MIISALTSYLEGGGNLVDIVKCYPIISFIDESGSKKCDVMNKYFLMNNDQDPKESKAIME